ncbi:MAG: hypothetical protein ACLRQF_12550 [Thomasclavelia ramosa]
MINQTIVRGADLYYQMSNATTQMINYNSEILYNGVLETLYEEKNYITDDSNENIDFSINYFYSYCNTCLSGSDASYKRLWANLVKKEQECVWLQ